MTDDGQRHSRRADRAFARYRRSGDPGAIATLFDLTAGELRRIATHVVGDAATADDLVQATFLAAIENAESFDGERPVLPWLTGILRKQALLVHRRERRRPDPARLPEAHELDPVRSAERAELDREVGDAIAQLPEIYRPVLQLYLLHGLGAAEIAATLERPGGTVRTQIVRGLEKLRELLPVGLAGLLAGLLPGTGTAGVRRAVLAAADRPLVLTTAAGLGGMLAMKKTMIGVAAALVALAAGLWSWQVAVSDDAGPVVQGASPMAASEETAAAPAEARDEHAGDRVRDARRAAVAAAPTGAVVRGRVLRDGVPVPGATVMAWRGGVYATTEVDGTFDPPPCCRTTADAKGAFALTGVPAEFLVSAEHEGLGCLTPLVGATRDRAEVAGLELALAPTLELEGVLLDHESRPIAGHRVATHRGSSNSESDRTDVDGVWRSRPHFLATTSDNEGRFSLRALADHRYLWEIQHPHHPMLRVEHRARDGRLVLRMEKGTMLAGRVFRADGSAAEGAEVILNDYPTRRAACDERGVFTLRGAALRDASYLRVVDAKSAVFALQPVPDDLVPIQIQLEAPRRIAGRVVDGEGRPRPDVEVSIEGDREIDPGYLFGGAPTWEWAHDLEKTTTGDDGTFAFERLYAGEFELQVSTADGSLKRTRTVHSGATTLEIRLDAATSETVTLRGRATDASTGAPLPGLRLTVWRREGGSSTGRTHDLLTEDGAYELPGLAPGELGLSAAAEGFAILRVPERARASGTHNVDLALFPERRLEVLVRDAAGVPQRGSVSVRDAAGKPVWMASGLHGSSTGRSLSEGHAVLMGLPATRVTVVVSVLGVREPIERVVDLIEPPSVPLTITVGAEAPRVPIELGVLCCTADADLSAFTGEPGPSWLDELTSREDVWPPDANVAVRLVGADGTVLSHGTIEAGELVEGERGLRLRHYASRFEDFDGTGSSTEGRPAPVAPAMLRGRAETMVLHVEADGYEPHAREIDGRASAGSMAKIAVFLRKKG